MSNFRPAGPTDASASNDAVAGTGASAKVDYIRGVPPVINDRMATAVIAGHRFTDVPNSNIFHGDITWLADHDITRGCNPPANDRFCPTRFVTREEMAQLEFLYLRALDDSEHGIPNLEAQVAASPMMFVQAVAYSYKRSDDREDPPEFRIDDPERRSAVALSALAVTGCEKSAVSGSPQPGEATVQQQVPKPDSPVNADRRR